MSYLVTQARISYPHTTDIVPILFARFGVSNEVVGNPLKLHVRSEELLLNRCTFVFAAFHYPRPMHLF